MTVAVTIGAVAIGSIAAAPAAGAQTFTREIAPVLREHCAGCHRTGGAAPFPLVSYSDARSRASLIALVTRTRYMPPWKPVQNHGSFAAARRLSDAQVALIQRWVEAGSPEGDLSDQISQPQFPEWELGRPDLIATMPDSFILPAEGTDVIRSFVIPIPVSHDQYVSGIEFRPGSAGVHHANIKLDVTGSSRRLDADDAMPGFEGSGRGAHFPNGHFLGWTPGQRPHVSADDAWLLPAGADLVVELHMTSTGKAETIQPQVGLQFTDQAPHRTPYMLRLSNQRLDIAANARDYMSTDEYVLPVSVDVIAVQPHAHNLARSIQGYAYLPDGRREWLIDIQDWDFRWQDIYRYQAPLRLPKGTRLEMRYTYDNSPENPKNPHAPPQRVTFGQSSDAEMGDLWLQVVTANAAERAALAADFDPKMLAEDTAGDEMLASSHPLDARIRRDLASCYEALGRTADARAQLEVAVTLEPDSADGHFQLGTLLLRARQLPEAVRSLRRAIAIAPGWSESYNNLGAALLLVGDRREALQAFDDALQRNPNSASAFFNKGRLLAAEGRGAEALTAFNSSLRIKPDDADTLAATGAASATTGAVANAIDFYRRALRLNADLVPALVDLAWILAAVEPGRPEQADEAVRLAERAAQLTTDNTAVLDTLAASYFAAGRVVDAVRTAERALMAAETKGDDRAIQDIGDRLQKYRGALRN